MTSDPRNLRRRRTRPAFTMVEIIVVVIIIAVLAALIVPRFFGEVGKAKQAVAKQQIATLGTAVEKFYYEHNRFPASLDELVNKPADVDAANWNPMVRPKDLIDPWGRPYLYKCPGSHDKYDLYSLGADGREGGTGDDADVHNW